MAFPRTQHGLGHGGHPPTSYAVSGLAAAPSLQQSKQEERRIRVEEEDRREHEEQRNKVETIDKKLIYKMAIRAAHSYAHQTVHYSILCQFYSTNCKLAAAQHRL